MVDIPSGREYYFPNAERTHWGSTYSTLIKNYPVQGFATGDIVPMACINIWKLMKQNKVRSLLINTVHDSVVADVHPDEQDLMISIFQDGCNNVKQSLMDYFQCDFNVPLDTEIKVGPNWLDLNII